MVSGVYTVYFCCMLLIRCHGVFLAYIDIISRASVSLRVVPTCLRALGREHIGFENTDKNNMI